MAIPDEDVAQVRAATDIVALVGEHTALKRVGRRFVGLCPFHTEKSGSFSVNAEEGLYYCFGCQASGDAITFVRAVEGCDFVEAVERLAARAGLAIRNEEDGRATAERGRRKELYDAVARAVDFYHERLLTGRDAGLARQYLRARGYDGDTVRQFRIGFAPAGFDELVRALRLAPNLLVEAGLAFSSNGRTRDAFRERVVFPIFDPGGRPIALGGRVLPPEMRREERDPGPKYRNSSESPVYQKRRTLYGLNWAKADMARAGEAVVCEGYTDVIGFFRAGVPRAVATCGTSLTEDHLRLLANFARRVVLAFDADRAGQDAAARIYEWERRHRVELAVATLPRGSDPAELASSDPDALAEAVRAARPFLGFQVDRVLPAAELHSPEGRARAAQSAIAVVAEHPDELVRDHYLIEIADRTHHDPAKLRALLEEEHRRYLVEGARAPSPGRPANGGDRDRGPRAAPGGPGVASAPRQGAPSARRGPRAGLDALALAIHRPADVAELFDEVLFVNPLQRRAFHALATASHLHEAIDGADPEVGDLLRSVAVTELESDADPEGTFIALARLAVETTLVAVTGEARRSAHEGESERLRTVAAVKEELELLRDPTDSPGSSSSAIDAARRLVAWMAQREGDRG